MGKVFKDKPIVELVLRRYEKPDNLCGRDLVKKVCLSIGLLQPGDSRDVIVDILHILLEQKQSKKQVSAEEIRDLVIKNRIKHGLDQKGVTHSNIRRQIKRLKDMLIVDNINNMYRISEYDKMTEIFNDRIKQYLLNSILTRLDQYANRLDQEYPIISWNMYKNTENYK